MPGYRYPFTVTIGNNQRSEAADNDPEKSPDKLVFTLPIPRGTESNVWIRAVTIQQAY